MVKQWEYQVVEVSKMGYPNEQDERRDRTLQHLGRAGWELTAVVDKPGQPFQLYLKRELPPPHLREMKREES